MNVYFYRLLRDTDKAKALQTAISSRGSNGGGQRFEVDVSSFNALPGAAFVYWIGERLRQIFIEELGFEAEGRSGKQGLATADDFRWVRTWWEPRPGDEGEAHIVSFAKGGSFSPYYIDIYLGVRWGESGRWIKEWKSGQLSRGLITPNNSKCWNESYYFRPGLTWPSRPHRRGGFSCVPSGTIFSVSGMMLFEVDDSRLLTTCALLNSAPYIGLLHTIMPRGSAGSGQTLKYELGYLTAVPVPSPDADTAARLGDLARRAWSLKRRLDTQTETSHAFVSPALLQVEGGSLAARADAWAGRVRAVEAELVEIQAEIDERCFDLYGIEEADRRAISEGLAGDAEGFDVEEPAGEVEEADDEQEVDAAMRVWRQSWSRGVLGWLSAGSMCGLRPAGESCLVSRSRLIRCRRARRGCWLVTTGCRWRVAPRGTRSTFPTSGVLIDDPGDPRDLLAAVRAVFDAVFGANADARWDEAASLLDPRGHDLRAWLRSGFFELHLKLHSKSRRKAPILWQLGTPSGRYSVWLYAHRLTDDSLFRVQSDVLAPKLAYEERQLANLVQERGWEPVGEGASRDRSAGGVCRGAAPAAR